MKLVVLLSALSMFLSGCTTLSDARLLSDKDKKTRDQLREHRVFSIESGDTLYSKSLQCLGSLKPDVKVKPNITVSRILDKTGKVFPDVGQEASTALSDMVMNALAKARVFEVTETPLEASTNHGTRVDITNMPLIQNNPVLIGQASVLPVGVLFPSDAFISGALIQYDESSDISRDNNFLSLGIDLLSYNKQVTVIKIGLHLRMLNSRSGKVTTINGKPMSLIATNRLLSMRKGLNLYKIISSENREIDYVVETSDPTHYAVYEMVEKTVFDLVAGSFGGLEQCSPKRTLLTKSKKG